MTAPDGQARRAADAAAAQAHDHPRLAGSLVESRRTCQVLGVLTVVELLIVAQWALFVAPDRLLPHTWTQVDRLLLASDTQVPLVVLGVFALASAAQFVLQRERTAERADQSRGGRALTAYAALGYFAVALVALLLEILLHATGTALFEVVVVLVGLIGGLVAALRPPGGDTAEPGDTAQPTDTTQPTGTPQPPGPAEHPDTTARPGPSRIDSPRPSFVMALSGGGIRAAAFALGAYHALQECPGRRLLVGDDDPHLVAVSGGSYLAASIAFVRRYVVTANPAGRGGPVATPPGGDDKPSAATLPWDTAYALGSPEVARLRRHTRDLVEPLRFLFGGALTLVVGALVNLLIAAGLIRISAWVLAWVYSTSGLLAVHSDRTGPGSELSLSTLHLFPDRWASPGVMWGVFSAPLDAGLLALALATLSLWRRQRQADDGLTDAPQRSRLAGFRALLVTVIGIWVLLMAVLPALLYGLTQAGLANEPTATSASVIKTLGFTDFSLCESAARRDLETAYRTAAVQAQLTPGHARTVVAGACGSTTDVTVTFPEVSGGQLSDSVRQQVIAKAAADQTVGPHGQIAGQLSALTAIVSAISVALRRAGANADPGSLSGWRGRIRRFLLAWLPLATALITVVWILLLWTSQLTLHPAARDSVSQGYLLLAALIAIIWIDANATSLHTYYRQRLSSAFAVARVEGTGPRRRARARAVSGVDRDEPRQSSDPAAGVDPDDAGQAVELPYETAYGFSEIDPVPLHIVTTANVRAYDEVPSRRGGVPMVFSPVLTRLMTSRGVTQLPTAAYEEAAGKGRVSVMSVVAMSGAAVSPMAGRFAATVAPYRMLLTAFNVRVGSWVPNPRWVTQGDQLGAPPTLWSLLRHWPHTPWLISRPGAAQVLIEAAGRSSINDRWLYLSDGGHLDNTGLVEAVRLLTRAGRPTQGRILLVDASNDASGTWSAVGDALAVVRTDLGIDLRCVQSACAAPLAAGTEPATAPGHASDRVVDGGRRRRLRSRPRPQTGDAEPEFMRLYRETDTAEALEVLVVKAVRPIAVATLPEPVRAFATGHPDFPRASTTRQDFGDLEFEAYRALGEFYAGQALQRWADRVVSAHADGE